MKTSAILLTMAAAGLNACAPVAITNTVNYLFDPEQTTYSQAVADITRLDLCEGLRPTNISEKMTLRDDGQATISVDCVNSQ